MLLNYFSKLKTAIDLEDVNMIIEDLNLDNLKAGSFHFKFGLLSINEKNIYEKLKYAKFNEKLIEYSKLIINYLQKNSSANLICITGSLAYRDARPWQDIDLMILSKRKNLMKTLLKILILNRKLVWNKSKVKLCINFVCSIEKFPEVISNSCSALVAFDLIKAIPSNPELYYSLLNNTNCIKKYFKINYEMKFSSNLKIRTSSYSLTDIILYIFLFIYFKFINYMRNLKLLKKRFYINLFNYDFKPDLFMIKSVKYEILKKEFEKIFLDF
jgi:predicted nucleotidyltransferase